MSHFHELRSLWTGTWIIGRVSISILRSWGMTLNICSGDAHTFTSLRVNWTERYTVVVSCRSMMKSEESYECSVKRWIGKRASLYVGPPEGHLSADLSDGMSLLSHCGRIHKGLSAALCEVLVGWPISCLQLLLRTHYIRPAGLALSRLLFLVRIFRNHAGYWWLDVVLVGQSRWWEGSIRYTIFLRFTKVI